MKSTSKLGRDGSFWGLVMVAPTIIGLMILNIIPFFQTIYMSFSKTKAFGAYQFCGLENYLEMFRNVEFWKANWNSLYFCILTVPVGVFLALIVAVLLTMDRTAITPGLKSASVVLMVLLLCGITHIIGGSAAEGTFAESIKALYRGGTALTGGGACAILFGVYPLRWLGRTGALIVDILLFFVFFMISTGTTLIGLFRGAAKPVKKLEEAYTAAVENRQAAAEVAEAAQKKNRRNFNIDVALEGEEKSPAAARKEALTKEGEASRRKVERLTDAMKVSTNTGRAYDFDSEPDKPVESTPAPEPQPDFQPVAPPVANAAPTPAETSIEDLITRAVSGSAVVGEPAAEAKDGKLHFGETPEEKAAQAAQEVLLEPVPEEKTYLPAGQPAGRAQGRLRRQYPEGAARQCRSAGGYAAQLRGGDPHRGYFPWACRYPV